MTLDLKIKQLRKERKWSQAELAEKLGIHMNHLSKLETAKFTPSLELLRKMSSVFEVSADYLLDESVDGIESLNIRSKSLFEKIRLIDQLDEKDQDTILNVLEAFITKRQMWDLLQKNTTGS